MNIYGPFRIDGFKNSESSETVYILTMMDIYSRYNKLHFFEKMRTQDVIDAFNDWESTFGPPKYAIFDNEKHFDNTIFWDFCLQER